jgi:hypothetical protein
VELWSREIGDFFIFLAGERSEPREWEYCTLFFLSGFVGGN